MKTSFIGIATFIILCFVYSSVFSQDIKHQSFSKEQIQTMKNTTAIINTKFGKIFLEFLPEVAPNHVNNFIELSKSGFYDGTIFHRVIPNFMIQGGDPNSKSKDRKLHGMGGPKYRLKAEFNKTPHKRGVLSMARSGHPDSAGSQFFICVADANFLNGQYTVFGRVTQGMDVADKIVSQARDARDNPLERIDMTIELKVKNDNSEQKDTNQKQNSEPKK